MGFKVRNVSEKNIWMEGGVVRKFEEDGFKKVRVYELW